MHDDFVALEVLQPRLVVEALDLRRNQHLQIFERKTFKGTDTRLAALDASPEVFDGGADGRDSTHTGDDDAFGTVWIGELQSPDPSAR